jgi:hypothetical protein
MNSMVQNRWFVSFFNALPLPLCLFTVLLATRASVSNDVTNDRLRRDVAATASVQRPLLVKSVHQMNAVARRFSDKPYGSYTYGYEYRRRRNQIDYPSRR